MPSSLPNLIEEFKQKALDLLIRARSAISAETHQQLAQKDAVIANLQGKVADLTKALAESKAETLAALTEPRAANPEIEAAKAEVEAKNRLYLAAKQEADDAKAQNRVLQEAHDRDTAALQAEQKEAEVQLSNFLDQLQANFSRADDKPEVDPDSAPSLTDSPPTTTPNPVPSITDPFTGSTPEDVSATTEPPITDAPPLEAEDQEPIVTSFPPDASLPNLDASTTPDPSTPLATDTPVEDDPSAPRLNPLESATPLEADASDTAAASPDDETVIEAPEPETTTKPSRRSRRS